MAPSEAEPAGALLDQLCEMEAAGGFLSASKEASWICTQSVTHLVVCWYRTGCDDSADRAMKPAELHQGLSGQFLGSCVSGAGSLRGVDLHRPTKYHLVAHFLRVRSFLENDPTPFVAAVPAHDWCAQTMIRFVQQGDRGLEGACWQVRLLRAMLRIPEGAECATIEIAPALLARSPRRSDRALAGSSRSFLATTRSTRRPAPRLSSNPRSRQSRFQSSSDSPMWRAMCSSPTSHTAIAIGHASSIVFGILTVDRARYNSTRMWLHWRHLLSSCATSTRHPITCALPSHGASA
jgi:hypothetical protein